MEAISTPSWNEELKLPNKSYSISDIQYAYIYIYIYIYIYKIESSLKFK